MVVETRKKIKMPTPIPHLPTPIPYVVTLPIDCETLNDALNVAAYRGRFLGYEATFPTTRAAYLCEAGKKTTITWSLPAGVMCTRRKPIEVTSDYYSKDIVMHVRCDGTDVTPFGVTLTGLAIIDFGQFYVKRHKIEFVVRNDSAVDAIVTIQASGVFIEEGLYEVWYKPLVDYSVEILKSLAEERGERT